MVILFDYYFNFTRLSDIFAFSWRNILNTRNLLKHHIRKTQCRQHVSRHIFSMYQVLIRASFCFIADKLLLYFIMSLSQFGKTTLIHRGFGMLDICPWLHVIRWCALCFLKKNPCILPCGICQLYMFLLVRHFKSRNYTPPSLRGLRPPTPI